MPWEIYRFDESNAGLSGYRIEEGGVYASGLASLWRLYLREADSRISFQLRSSGLPWLEIPWNSEGAAKLRVWAAGVDHYLYLAAEMEGGATAGQILDRAAGNPAWPPEICGPARYECWHSSAMVDSYNSVEVLVIALYDCATGRQIGFSRDFEDLTIEPVRFLAPRRLLVHSGAQNADYEVDFDRNTLHRC